MHVREIVTGSAPAITISMKLSLIKLLQDPKSLLCSPLATRSADKQIFQISNSRGNCVKKMALLIILWNGNDRNHIVDKVKREHCVIRQDNTIRTYKCSIKLSFSSIDEDKSKLQKQIVTYFN